MCYVCLVNYAACFFVYFATHPPLISLPASYIWVVVEIQQGYFFSSEKLEKENLLHIFYFLPHFLRIPWPSCFTIKHIYDSIFSLQHKTLVFNPNPQGLDWIQSEPASWAPSILGPHTKGFPHKSTIFASPQLPDGMARAPHWDPPSAAGSGCRAGSISQDRYVPLFLRSAWWASGIFHHIAV